MVDYGKLKLWKVKLWMGGGATVFRVSISLHIYLTLPFRIVLRIKQYNLCESTL